MVAVLPADVPLLFGAIFTVTAFAVLALSTRARQRSFEFVVDYGVFVLFAVFAAVGVYLFFRPDTVDVESLLREYWLAALFAIFVLEGAMLMYFAPSEGLVPAAIGLAKTTDLRPDTYPEYALIIGTAVAGATVGQFMLFLVAKRWGRDRLLERPWFRIGDENLAKFEGWFDRWGLLAVPISNTLPFTRGMLTVPAGLAEMDERTFVVLSALGTLSFELLLALAALTTFQLGFV